MKFFFSFQERKMVPFNTKNCTFLAFTLPQFLLPARNVVIFRKVEDWEDSLIKRPRLYYWRACFQRHTFTFFFSRIKTGVTFTERKVKSVIVNKHERLNSFGSYNSWIRQCLIHYLWGSVDRDSGGTHTFLSMLWNVQFHSFFSTEEDIYTINIKIAVTRHLDSYGWLGYKSNKQT